MSRFLIGLLVAICCFTSACTGDGGDTAAAADDQPPGSLPSASDSASGLDAMGLAGMERLELALVRPESYRPDEVVLTDQSGVIISDLLYDGLTEAHGTVGVLRPGLAASWSADDDFRRWTFELDPFAGVTAEEVVGALDPLTRDRVEAQPRGRSVAALAAGISSVRAPDDGTVVIELDRANAGLPWVLSGLPFSVVGEGGTATGDFAVASDDDDGMVLRRRIGRLAGDGRGLREIAISWVDEPGEGYRMLDEGVVDAAVIDQESVGAAANRYDAEFPATSAVRYYVLNPESHTLAERAGRAQVLAAVDPRVVVEQVPGLSLTTADGLVPATMTGYRVDACGPVCGPGSGRIGNDEGDAGAVDSGGDGAGGDGADSGGGDDSTLDSGDGTDGSGSALQISYAGEEQAAVAEAVAAQLVTAGYHAEWDELGARELAGAIVAGSTDLFAFGWVAPATSVDAVLPPLLSLDSPANVARIDSEGLTRLLDEAARTADDEARWELLDQAHRAAMAEAKLMPVATSTSLLVRSPDVADLVVRADGSIDLEVIR